MRLTPRTSLALATGLCAVALAAGQPALAESDGPARSGQSAPAAPVKGCLPEGETGVYLSKEGTAKVTFSKAFRDGLERAGVTVEGIEPVRMTDDGTAAVMPIGEKYDTVEFPSGRVCHPGGFRLTRHTTGQVYEVDNFRVLFVAYGDSKFLTTPKVDGRPDPAGELTMLNFSVPQAFTTGEFVRHNGGVGPKRVVMTMDDQWARHLNGKLGTGFTHGMHLFDTDIAWKGLPTKPFPTTAATPSPGVAGLAAVADAIRPGLT
ncbi:hypothetical protein ACLGI4_05220 [Streptomyces sp. HMX112]|uniref:hypothetical protein n=1 Tax=Streptomyces sp. HMX112 TaxID=3390850 RepID=UPI003A80197B